MALSEGAVFIKRNIQTCGELVHQPQRTEFLTLFTKRANPHDSNTNELVVVDAAETTFKLVIGKREYAVFAPLVDLHTPIIENFVVYEGEQVWVSTNNPNKYIVYGFVTRSPHQ